MPFAIALLAIRYPRYHLLFFFLVLLLSLLNDLFFFVLGRLGRVRLAPLWPNLLSTAHLRRGEAYFERFGLFAFFAGRFIPFGLGNSIVLSAGIAHLSMARFLPWTLSACAIYALFYFYGTFLFGPTLFATKWSALLTLGVIAALLISVKRAWSKDPTLQEKK